MQDFEKLATFYLGRGYDVDSGEADGDTLLYDAKDLTTHAVCVGMTGSGKTGLCVTLLEEAAIDGVPSIVIDPKGDMGNLMLGFPKLRPQDFEPWIDPGEAARKGRTVAEHAESVAELWKNGLADWGQKGERIKRLHDAVEMALYTPGSTNGLPITVLRSFDAPAPGVLADPEALGDRVQSAVAGLLALVGIDADPIKSRESILLANILQRAWSAGRDLDVADLIREIQSPPFQRLGVLDLDSFFPEKDRFELAMALNNLLASPNFAAWMEGEPLDIGKLLYTAEGKPRVAILSIAHLSDAERMFFVTILLNEFVTWMRTQPGTSSLRALLYMDEIFGYFPPTKEPPSKKPMLTLLKQARAFGIGVVLATQNPVDLDYKGLSNTGTWLIGRLQTERDKLRVLDGLEGAMTGGGKKFSRAEMDRVLSSLGKRVFLMNNVHEDGPVVFHTRWALSYLRGPLNRDHVRLLSERSRPSTPPVSAGAKKVAATATAAVSAAASHEQPQEPAQPRPVIAKGVRELFLPRRGELVEGEQLVYRPVLYSEGKLHFASAREKIDEWRRVTVVASVVDDLPPVDWDEASVRDVKLELDWRKKGEAGARFAALPPEVKKKTSFTGWARDLKNHVYQTRSVQLYKAKKLKLTSHFGETKREFSARLHQVAAEQRDMQLEKLRKKYAPRLARAQERIRKANEKLGVEEEQYEAKRRSSWIDMGSSLLGALFGRKVKSSSNARRAGSVAKSMGRTSKEKADIARAKRTLEAETAKLADLEDELQEEADLLEDEFHPSAVEITESVLRPRKSDISLSAPALVWLPWRVDASGIAEPAHGLKLE